MAYCRACGTELEAEAAYCPACGTAADAAPETAATDDSAGTAATDDSTAAPTVEVRDDWWQVLVALPVVIPFAGLHQLFVLPWLGFWILYPVALWYDARYVDAISDSWDLDERRIAALSVLGFVSLGLLSYLISPYYVYKRRQHL